MRVRDFEFNLRELAGSMGDFGTLFPLAIGYFVVTGLNPAGLFPVFPQSITGAMLLLVGIELTRFVRNLRLHETPIMALTVVLSLLTNMAIGFIAAVGLYHILRRWGRSNRYINWIVRTEDE